MPQKKSCFKIINQLCTKTSYVFSLFDLTFEASCPAPATAPLPFLLLLLHLKELQIHKQYLTSTQQCFPVQHSLHFHAGCIPKTKLYPSVALVCELLRTELPSLLHVCGIPYQRPVPNGLSDAATT